MENYSSTYVAIIVNLLSVFLPKLGVTVGNKELTTTIQTLVVLASGLWVLIERYKKGDVTVVGFRKA